MVGGSKLELPQPTWVVACSNNKPFFLILILLWNAAWLLRCWCTSVGVWSFGKHLSDGPAFTISSGWWILSSVFTNKRISKQSMGCAENGELMGVSRVSMTFQWISWGVQIITSIAISPWNPDPNDWDFSGVIETTIIHWPTNLAISSSKHEHMNPTCWSEHGFKSYARQKKSTSVHFSGESYASSSGVHPCHPDTEVKTYQNQTKKWPIQTRQAHWIITIYIHTHHYTSIDYHTP